MTCRGRRALERKDFLGTQPELSSSLGWRAMAPCVTSPHPESDRLGAKQLRMCLLLKRFQVLRQKSEVKKRPARIPPLLVKNHSSKLQVPRAPARHNLRSGSLTYRSKAGRLDIFLFMSCIAAGSTTKKGKWPQLIQKPVSLRHYKATGGLSWKIYGA